MAIITHWCIEKNIYGPQMGKIFMTLPWPKMFMALQWPKIFTAPKWPKIFMALKWSKILLAKILLSPITLNTYALFKMKRGDKISLKCRQGKTTKVMPISASLTLFSLKK